MKKILALILALALTAAMAGCGMSGEPEATQQTQVPTEGAKTVSSVDELLAAIAPNTEILLAEGTYAIHEAADYGKGGSNPYYTWNDLGLGEYELQIRDVENLTIRGSGKDATTLVTSPRFANVLSLAACKNVTLEAMTLGHTEMAEACEGGVIRLESCENTALQDLGLYGCGTLGIYSIQSQELNIRGCSIYDCSIGGIDFWQTKDVSMEGCEIYSLGDQMPVSYLFNIVGSENVTVSDCAISDTYTQQMIYTSDSSNVAFRDNRFTSCQVAEYAFFFQEPVILVGNTFEQCEPRQWYGTASALGVDDAGENVVFEEAASEPMEVTPGVATPVTTGEQKEVRVKTVDEFIQALAPDTCIILEGELFDFSKATGYGTSKGEYYYWVDNYDGPGLVIQNLSNLTILAEGEDRLAHTLSATPRYADVLTFENCSAITLSGFTAGHTVEQGACTGGVLLFRNCEDVLVDNCGLYGCGTEGVNGEYSRNIQIVNSEIYECSNSGIELSYCENVAISDTLIRDIRSEWGEGHFFRFYGNTNVTLDGEPLDGNYIGS